MNFELSEDQRMLVDAATSFARKQSPVARFRKLRDEPRAWSLETWRAMGDLGWIGLAVPEAAGGIGGTIVDAALVLEQLGQTLVPEPLASTLVAAAALAGAPAQEAVLADVIAGKATLALAWAETESRYDPARIATRADAQHRLTGHKRFVLDGDVAARFVVSARDPRDRLALYLVDATAARVRPVKTLDGRRAALIELDAAPSEPVAGADDALEVALDIGAALACAEGVGIMRAVLAMTVEYLRTREQFGVKIGTFQVLQHRAVDMFVETELAYSAMLAAAIRLSDGSAADVRRAAVAAAKVQLTESGRFVTQQAIQLHGGIGITDEHDVGLFFKRMQVLTAIYGDAEHQLSRFAGMLAG